MENAATGSGVSFSGFLTADQHRVRDAFIDSIRAECATSAAQAIIQNADAAVRAHQSTMPPPNGRLTNDELQESLLFYRRRLAGRLAVAMIHSASEGRMNYPNPAQFAEDLANAICERLAARETGRPEGYK